MNTTLQPIEELDNLSEDQRDQLRDWLTELSIRKTMAKLRDEWSIIITYNKLQRYRQRLLTKDQVSEHLDHKMAMTEFLDLLNGNPVPYDEAGLALIQKRAFEAACAPKIAVSSLATLQRIFNYKNARADIEFRKKIAERNTAVREAKLALDRQKLSFSHGRGAPRSTSIPLVPKAPTASVPSVGPDSPQLSTNVKNPSADSATSALDSDSVPCDHLGPLARTWEDVRRRAQIKFGITPEESARRAELRRTRRNPYNNNNNNGGTNSMSPSTLNNHSNGTEQANPSQGMENPHPDYPNPVEGSPCVQDAATPSAAAPPNHS